MPTGRQEFMMREEALTQPAASHAWLGARDMARSVTQVSDCEGEG